MTISFCIYLFFADPRSTSSRASRNVRLPPHRSQRGSLRPLRHRARVAREDAKSEWRHGPWADAECPSPCGRLWEGQTPRFAEIRRFHWIIVLTFQTKLWSEGVAIIEKHFKGSVLVWFDSRLTSAYSTLCTVISRSFHRSTPSGQRLSGFTRRLWNVEEQRRMQEYGWIHERQLPLVVWRLLASSPW